jgi:hypothetical protein
VTPEEEDGEEDESGDEKRKDEALVGLTHADDRP